MAVDQRALEAELCHGAPSATTCSGANRSVAGTVRENPKIDATGVHVGQPPGADVVELGEAPPHRSVGGDVHALLESILRRRLPGPALGSSRSGRTAG